MTTASVFQGKYGPWALVTGASSGLGKEFARQLAEKGLHIILVARRTKRLEELAKQLEAQYSIKTKVFSTDLSDISSIEKLLEETEDLLIGLLINNAGYSATGELVKSDRHREINMLHVNCTAPLILSLEFAKRMERRGQGGIINISSSVAFIPVPNWSHYSATRAYTLFLGEGLHRELKDKGIDILTVCPGGMKTEFQEIAGIQEKGAMSVEPVARLALHSLGRKAVVIPGLFNRVFYYYLGKFLPRQWMSLLLGKIISQLSIRKGEENHAAFKQGKRF